MMRIRVVLLSAALLSGAQRLAAQDTPDPTNWPAYGRDPGGIRSSPLTQITPANVENLEVAWTYRTGDIPTKQQGASFEATPILIDGTLYLSTPFNRIIALDPQTGGERWRFDPQLDVSVRYSDFTSRGVSTWLDAERAGDQPCKRRIFHATNDSRLLAVDAATGKPCGDFGNHGQVDISRGVGKLNAWEYGSTSPPAILRDLVIVGTKVADNQRVDAPSGVVRAFDARTGAVRWSWEAVPNGSHQGDVDSFGRGTANAWAPLSVDAGRDLVFVPTGNTSPDYFGGHRNGSEEFASSIVALRGSNGTVVWHFQTVHHDLWDYDVPAQPALINVHRDGHDIAAVAQATKMGHIFILNRETGEPLFAVEERPVPQTDVPGEHTSPTQPFPTAPPPLVPARLLPDDAWGVTPFDRAWCRNAIAAMRSEGIFTPPSLKGTVMLPGNGGGSNWGSVAYSPERGLLIANTMNMPFAVGLIPRDRFAAEKAAHPDMEISPQTGTPYGMSRHTLLSPLGIPCNAPPWGTLAAIDVNNGTIRWQVPFGTLRDIFPVPIPFAWGTPNLGGPLVTASGLIFIGAAMDNYLRAFDIETGKELWKGRLPAGGQATPMTYQLANGKQYVVIAAGGHARGGTTLGDYVVAYKLP